MDKKKTKSGKKGTTMPAATGKGKHTSTQATGPKRQAVEMSKRKNNSTADPGMNFGMWQG